MCSFSKKLRSTVLITAVVLFGGTYQVWAFPSRHIASPAGHSVVIHLCKPGNKNCNPVTGGTPVPCSKTHAEPATLFVSRSIIHSTSFRAIGSPIVASSVVASLNLRCRTNATACLVNSRSGDTSKACPKSCTNSRSDKILDLTARSDCSDLCADPFG